MADERPWPEDRHDAGFLDEYHGEPAPVPAVRPAWEVEPDVLEGVVVDDAPPSGPARVVHAARAAVRHERTHAAARNAAYVAVGAAVVFRAAVGLADDCPLRAGVPGR